MNSRLSRADTGLGVGFIVSAVIHLAVFLLLTWWGRLFPPQLAIQETYYVDVINLPAAEPRSGAPVPVPAESEAAPSPVPLPATKITPPSTPSRVAVKTARPTVPQDSAATEAAFAERMANLERKTEASHEEAVLEKLRSRLKAGGNNRAGMPGAGGADAGSRYADYLKSRLEDALKITSSYTTRNPEVAVRLFIAADGRLVRMKVERSSGDAAFELAVRRAIDLAAEKFTAPPNRSTFENGFVFRPKGITTGKPR